MTICAAPCQAPFLPVPIEDTLFPRCIFYKIGGK